jgi:hypothetical protein
VRQALSELTMFEDIVQDGRVAYGDVGIWCSETMDIWGPVVQPFGLTGQHFNTWLAAKRAMYIALQHAELAVDMVVEDDFGATLNSYKLIVLTDTHVSTTASTGLTAWVAAGGTLLATAGAGEFDEMNKTNAVMAKLLGIASSQGAVLIFEHNVPLEDAIGSHATDHGPCHTPLNGLNIMFHLRMPLVLTPARLKLLLVCVTNCIPLG